MPAQRSGATAGSDNFSDTCSTKSWCTTMVFEYPPYVGVPSFARELYVPTPPFRQYCSNPSLQLSHVLQESTRQPTAARSPILNFVTSLPTFTTLPTISWPGTIGKIPANHSFLI